MNFNDYVFLHANPPSVVMERMSAVLLTAGWIARAETGRGRLFTPSDNELAIRPIGPVGLMIGRYAGASDSALDRHGRPDPDRLVQEGWGRYLVFWDAADGVAVLRDPGGGLDAAAWSRSGVDIVASALDTLPDDLWPTECTVDYAALGRFVLRPAACTTGIALTGVEAVTPGSVMTVSRSGVRSRQAWRPSELILREADPSPVAMRRRVDEAVDVLVDAHPRFVGEISGGFDSAAVAASAARRGRGAGMRWLNYHAGQAESDERLYAQAVAERAGLTLDMRRKQVRALDEGDLAPLTSGLRPALQGLDVEYDADAAAAMAEDGATALLTGQGGDAVFFQAGSPALVVDRVRRLGLKGLSRRFLHETAQWTRVSVWTLADIALRDRLGLPQRASGDGMAEPTAGVHPWLDDLEDAPPAKRGQVRQLVNCQVFQGDCLRRRQGELLHPLMSQPMMEHGLALPADILTDGGVDRALARRAFADRIPREILDRRGKGELTTYYGHVVRESLPWFRPLLLDGLLVRHGVLDRTETEILLDPDVLIWSGEYNLVLIRVLLELWARRWTDRLETRAARAVSPPDG